MSVRYTTLEGRKVVVCSAIILRPQVLSGSGGSIYYPKDQIINSVSDANGKPICVFHPSLYSQAVPAGLPEIFDRQKVGTMFNAKWQGNSLQVECWLDVDRMKTVDPAVWDMVKNGRMMEVSTGLFIEQIPRPGVWNGVQYHSVAQGLRFDHLALLPPGKDANGQNIQGACSIKDGCGLFRINIHSADKRESERAANEQFSKEVFALHEKQLREWNKRIQPPIKRLLPRRLRA